jgi:hypothetical protein
VGPTKAPNAKEEVKMLETSESVATLSGKPCARADLREIRENLIRKDDNKPRLHKKVASAFIKFISLFFKAEGNVNAG